MQQYLDFLRDILNTGQQQTNRTGVDAIRKFGCQMRFDLQAGFPLVTTKKIHLRSVFRELLWFIRGDTNIQYLNDHGVTIWDEWADEEGALGPVYGKQWRAWPTAGGQEIDQLSQVIDAIRRDPYSRRHIVSAWNVGELNKMALPPCHLLFQFFVSDGRLSCMLTQRSADAFLGVPFNIASYALLTHMVAQQCDLDVGEFIWSGGDCHIYVNHLDQVRTQCARAPHPLPSLTLHPRSDINAYCFEDFVIEGYTCHPVIKAPIAV